METKTTLLKSCLLALFLLISTTAFSATYYVCAGGTILLSDPPVDANLTYTWDIKLGGTSIPSYPSTTKPTSMPSTPGTYSITLTSTSSNPAICAPDVATHTIIVLPPLAITISAPSNTSYCGTATTPSSAITPTPSGLPGAYSSDLEYDYSYTVSKDGAAAVNGTTYGTVNATTGVYTLTTTTPGSYEIIGVIKYKNKSGGTTTLTTTSSTSGCPTSSTSRTVTVTTAPTAPTITVG